MAKDPPPRNYFLNEKHELTPTEKPGGGQVRRFNGIDWAAKGLALYRSLSAARKMISESPDPCRESRFFLAVLPEKELRQPSGAKKAKNNERTMRPDFASGADASSLRRLGLDVLGVARTGEAMVHATVERLDQLTATSQRLDDEGIREKALWAALALVNPIPMRFRVDESWLARLAANERFPVVFEFQPVLKVVEADALAREIRRAAATHSAFEFDAAGTLYSGRKWYRAKATPQQIRRAAEAFQSVQRIHQPHLTPVSVVGRGRPASVQPVTGIAQEVSISQLPTVALIDAGVPREHPALKPYRRGGYANQDGVTEAIGSHASFVASRLVFEGFHAGNEAVDARCRFFDVNVASPETHEESRPLIDDQALVTSMLAITNIAPDIRVFNLSLGAERSLDSESEVDRLEKLAKLSELDNFTAQRDLVVVVAAGNSPAGIAPGSGYPDHLDDPAWRLGHWACAFNALTVGAYVGQANTDGVARVRGAPSPFTLAGPSPIARAPKPDHAGPGGDGGAKYNWKSGLGVHGLNAEGLVEDMSGTSQAVPVVSQVAARTLTFLGGHCPPGARPFAALLRAALALASEQPAELSPKLVKAAKRTLGRGVPRLRRLTEPQPSCALLFWQGSIPDTKRVARVRVPLPREWVADAAEPRLRLVFAWLSPTNDAYSGWACRKVSAALRPASPAGAKGLKLFKRVLAHGHYPVTERIYDLNQIKAGIDEAILELKYDELHEPPISARPFTAETKVGVVIELIDASPSPLSPHAALRTHPLIQVATQLSVSAPGIAVPLSSSRPLI